MSKAPKDAAPKSLDAKERRFVSEYLIDLDANRAGLAAGYSATMARTKCYMWVSDSKTKPHVYAAVQRAQGNRSARLEITADRVAQELARIGFSDIRMAVRWREGSVADVVHEGQEDQPHGGSLKRSRADGQSLLEVIASDEIDDATAAAISEISQTANGLKIKFHDKQGALVNLARHLGMFTDRIEHTGAAGAPIETTTEIVVRFVD